MEQQQPFQYPRQKSTNGGVSRVFVILLAVAILITAGWAVYSDGLKPANPADDAPGWASFNLDTCHVVKAYVVPEDRGYIYLRFTATSCANLYDSNILEMVTIKLTPKQLFGLESICRRLQEME